MRTNIEIEDKLLATAMRVGKYPTKRAAVEAGLRLLVQTRDQAGVKKLRGKVEFFDDYDYKAMRGNPHADWNL